MVDWKSPAEITKDAVAFNRFIHVLLGVYLWEWGISLDYDWQFITGKRQFRWPTTFYFLGRYCMLFAMIGLTIASNVQTEINCQSLYIFLALCGTAALGFASINLSLRTMAIWSRRWYIVLPLVVLILGHWSLLMHGVFLTATFVPGQGCVITSTNTPVLIATWIYSMSFDFIVLLLTTIKLVRMQSGIRSRLMELVFRDGLIYFIVAFLSNVLATTFMLLNLNPVMSIIANVPAVVISTIVACRVVRRLSNYAPDYDANMLPWITQGSIGVFGTRSSRGRPKVSSKVAQIGVHVQMETFDNPASGNEKPTHLSYDAAGKMGKDDGYDPDSKVIHDEFKRPP